MRGRQPRLERHVGVAWLCCYAAYKLSCAQLIQTSKPEQCCFGTLPFSFLAESVQSTRLSLQPSELAPPPAPLPASKCCPPGSKGAGGTLPHLQARVAPLLVPRGDTIAGGRGGGGSQFARRGRHSYVICEQIRMLEKGKDQILEFETKELSDNLRLKF